MIITARDAQYLHNALTAIEMGTPDIPLSDVCPECGDRITGWVKASDPTEGHVMIKVTSDVFAVLIGCEGYWTIDPTLIGLPRDGWMSDASGDEATGVHAFDPRPMAERNGLA